MAKGKAPPRPQPQPRKPPAVRTLGVSVGLLPVAFIAGVIVAANLRDMPRQR